MPGWAKGLSADDARALIDALRRELGRDSPATESFYASQQLIDGLRLADLAVLAAQLPRAQWPALVRQHLVSQSTTRAVGDRVEALAVDLAAARGMLRLVPMRRDSVPAGGVAVASIVPQIVEMFALDAASSLRLVGERLVGSWGVSLEELARQADSNVRRTRHERVDRSEVGRPKVRALVGAELCAGTYARQLEHFAPDAVGLLGTVVAVPHGRECLYRAVDPEPDLRGDLVELALLAHEIADSQPNGLLGQPIWRRPDGSYRLVTFRISEQGALLESSDPAFEGVLTALAPLRHLAVPSWAAALSAPEYTLFAGLVSASLAVWPEEVAALAEALGLAALVDTCRSVDDDLWPDVIADALETSGVPQTVGRELLANAALAPDRVRSRIIASLAPLEIAAEGVEVRATSLPGLVETLQLSYEGRIEPVPAGFEPRPSELGELFGAAEKRVIEGLTVAPLEGSFLAPRAYTISAPAAALPLLNPAEWLQPLSGAGGLIVAAAGDEQAIAIPVDDVLAVLDLPALVGTLVGLAGSSNRPVPPTVVWVGPAGRAILQPKLDADGACRAVEVHGPLRALAGATTLPRQPPLALGRMLDQRRWPRFVAALAHEFVRRLEDDPGGLLDVRGANLMQWARECSALPVASWPGHLSASFDDIAARRARLDHLEHLSTYEEARPYLMVRAGSGEMHPVSRTMAGRLSLWLALAHPPRYRPLSPRTIARWAVEEDACWRDAASNLLAMPGLTEEPIEGGHPAWRALYAADTEAEAAGLFLHWRHPANRHGFVVSITHGSRAHFVDLDIAGAVQSVPAFADLVAAIFLRANEHGDAHSSSLLWLKRDGSLLELFDALEPIPSLDRLPPEFARLAQA